MIYIDPPYNTGNKDWVYNDKFVGANDRWRHSQWLEFLYQRLVLARELLTSDGVILVSINDENRSRLELLMDEVFPGRRLGSLVWRTKDTGNDLDQRFSHVHEHVLVYGNNDTILDFFAGSGSTGQAVLELNVEDGGNRRFILCSSTEATAKEPDKNLCRDVCAERLRRVMVGYGGKPGYSVAQGGEFAYLQLDKIEAADVAFEATPQHATTLISMKNTAVAPVEIAQAAIQIIAIGGDWLTVICHTATPEAVNALAALPAQHGLARLAVFCPRPKALAALLAERGVEANTYSIADALLKGQVRGKTVSLA